MSAFREFSVQIFCVLLAHTALGDDWPQWRGPRQDGISRETGLLAQWPEKGPAELWRVPLGNGFSAVSVVGEKAFTLFGSKEGEFAAAFRVADGKPLWKTRLSDLLKNDSYGDGPRATPAIDSGRVYALSGKGALMCLDVTDGHIVWSCDLLQVFHGEPPEYGFAASPLVMGNMLVVVVGARKGKSLVAFDKANGNVLWTALDDKIGYSTPRAVTIDGVSQIIVLMGEALVSVSPTDGKEYWRQEWKTELDANVATPVISGNRLFISTGYSTGCALFELSVKDGKPAAEKVWANKEMKNYFSTSVLVDGYLYGFNNNKLTCLDFRTGKTRWKAGGFNRGSLIAADGKLIIYGEQGLLALAEISPDSYKELAKVKFCDERTWTVPTLSGGRLFLRNEKELACLKVGDYAAKTGRTHGTCTAPFIEVTLVPRPDVIEISAGLDDGLHQGDKFLVDRPSTGKYIGVVEVIDTSVNRAICRPDPKLSNGPIRKGDSVHRMRKAAQTDSEKREPTRPTEGKEKGIRR